MVGTRAGFFFLPAVDCRRSPGPLGEADEPEEAVFALPLPLGREVVVEASVARVSSRFSGRLRFCLTSVSEVRLESVVYLEFVVRLES